MSAFDPRLLKSPVVVGRELDALVDEIVFGHAPLSREEMAEYAKKTWRTAPGARHFSGIGRGFWADGTGREWRFFENVPRYSGALEPAFTVVDKLLADGLAPFVSRNFSGTWAVTFTTATTGVTRGGKASQLPQAICVAALAPDCGHAWSDYEVRTTVAKKSFFSKGENYEEVVCKRCEANEAQT